MEAGDFILSVPACSAWQALFIGYLNELMDEL